MAYNVEELRNLIDKADSAYYRPGHAAIMTDIEYDRLKEQLRTYCPKDPRMSRVGLPYDVSEMRNKVKHNIPMGSLDNVEGGIEGFSKWFASVGSEPFVASLKVDGASICATYRNGQLVRVATRGNGSVGENITSNAVNFKGLPTNISHDGDIDVRGEAILYKEDFIKICDNECIAEKDRSNPRNVGNGILGRDDGRNSEYIRFVAFNVEGIDAATVKEKYMFLSSQGFQVVEHQLFDSVDAFVTYFQCVESKRDKLPHEIDGVVVILNSVKSHQRYITANTKSKLRPKFARAVKFTLKTQFTQLIGVELSVGHTGAIIPTGLLKEVRIGGVNVSRVLLNNWDEIDRLGLHINDTVEVALAGDIIPKIISVEKTDSTAVSINEPTNCPSCNSRTTRNFRDKGAGANLFCSNKSCRAVEIGKIDHWIGNSKKGVGILGIGDSILEVLYDSGKVKDPADLYSLTVDDIQNLRMKDSVAEVGIRIGQSRSETIVKNIKERSVLPLPVFLGALGVDLLGTRRAQLMIESTNGGLDTIEQWLDEKNLRSIEFVGLGETIRDAVIDGINENRALIQKLVKNGVKIMKVESKVDSGKKLSGLSFCLTGTRAHIEDIERMGGTIKSGVSKGLDFLVQADPLSTSGKSKKAEEYGVKIISIDYLKAVIEGKEELSKDD